MNEKLRIVIKLKKNNSKYSENFGSNLVQKGTDLVDFGFFGTLFVSCHTL